MEDYLPLLLVLAAFTAPYIWLKFFSNYVADGFSDVSPSYQKGDWRGILFVSVLVGLLCVFGAGANVFLTALGLH